MNKYIPVLNLILQTSKRCWRGEFVEMTIWNLQSLLVCPIIRWKSSVTRDEWISGWRSWLASLILNWCLAFSHYMWWCVFWYIRDPCAGGFTHTFPDIPCVSQMCGGLSLRLSIPTERFCNSWILLVSSRIVSRYSTNFFLEIVSNVKP